MSDQQIIEALIARDEQVTRQFFFGNCRPLFLSIIRRVFSYEVDYDEVVNAPLECFAARQFHRDSTFR